MWTIIYIKRAPEGEKREREKRAEILFKEIMAPNSPDTEKDRDIQI